MKIENKIVHTLWVGSELSLLECLTIKLLQNYGHEVHLWTYGDIGNAPENVVLRDAEEVLPKSSIFRYTGLPINALPNGGIGSLSHWSDQFQLKLLSLYGGIYIQLDVACLKPLDFEHDYTFISHMGQSAVAAFLMKCPRDSLFTKAAYMATSASVNPDTMKNIDWDESMRVIGRTLAASLPDNAKYRISSKYFVDLGCRTNGPFFDNNPLPEDVYIIHWSNATVNQRKNDPIKGSIYHDLLISVGLA